MRDIVHARCRAEKQKRRSYAEITCLDCGEKSVIAINSFYVLASGYDMKEKVSCKPKEVMFGGSSVNS